MVAPTFAEHFTYRMANRPAHPAQQGSLINAACLYQLLSELAKTLNPRSKWTLQPPGREWLLVECLDGSIWQAFTIEVREGKIVLYADAPPWAQPVSIAEEELEKVSTLASLRSFLERADPCLRSAWV